MPDKKKPTAFIEIGDLLEVRRNGDSFLFVTPDTRDAIIAANTFLAVMFDQAEKTETLTRLNRVMKHLSDMLYGFPDIPK